MYRTMERTFLILLFSLLATCGVRAQTEQPFAGTVANGDSIDLTAGMAADEDELMNDYNNRTNLSEGVAVARDLPYDDQLILNRLSRIPTTIDLPLNDVTRKYIDTYSNRMRRSVSIMLGAANFYMPIFEEALERYSLPLELKYLPVIESALRPSATSRAGASGLWQFMPATGKHYGLEINTLVDERRDPLKSSEAAARYLRDLYKMFGDWGLAIAAYNCGEYNVQKALLRLGDKSDTKDYWSIYNSLPHETRGYVPAFIAATYIMNYYCEHGITPMEATLPAASDTIVVVRDVKFSQIASVCNVTTDELRALNPQYRHDIVPQTYAVRLPAQSIELFITHEDSIYGLVPTAALASASSPSAEAGSELAQEAAQEAAQNGRSNGAQRAAATSSRRSRNSRSSRNQTKKVSVRNGDSLSSIARRNGTTVANLRRLNNLRGNMIHPGQRIRVK